MVTCRHVVFYVSSYGLGHVTRCVEVARAFLEGTDVACDSSTQVTIVTKGANCEILGAERVEEAGDDCFNSLVLRLSNQGSRVVAIRDRDLDAGARQKDAFCIDVDATREAAVEFYTHINCLIEEEVDWLRRTSPDVVVSDVVGLALPAAKRAGIPGVLMTNFSWAYIYRPLIREGSVLDDGFRDVVKREEDMLGAADLFLRLPGFSRFEPQSLESRAIDVPLVVRAQREGRAAMRARLGVDPKTNVCLLMVGGHSLGVEMDWSKIYFGGDYACNVDSSWICFVTASVLGEQDVATLPSHIRAVPPTAYIPDMVAMSDVVLGKVGYGTVSECLSGQTPLVYVPRENFAEEQDIVTLLNSHAAGLEMSRDVFLSGKWGEALNTAIKMRSGIVKADTSGAQVVARMLRDVSRLPHIAAGHS